MKFWALMVLGFALAFGAIYFTTPVFGQTTLPCETFNDKVAPPQGATFDHTKPVFSFGCYLAPQQWVRAEIWIQTYPGEYPKGYPATVEYVRLTGNYSDSYQAVVTPQDGLTFGALSITIWLYDRVNRGSTGPHYDITITPKYRSALAAIARDE